jgi:hypothetical protein
MKVTHLPYVVDLSGLIRAPDPHLIGEGEGGVQA